MSSASKVADSAARMLSALPVTERRSAVDALRRLVEREMFDLSSDDGDGAIACPEC